MRELAFYAHAQHADGDEQTFSVYKRGNRYEIIGPNYEQHVCHPAATTRSKVLGEIGLVFGVSITRISGAGAA